MNRPRRIIAFITAAIIAMLTGCSDDSVIHKQMVQTQITLSWWGNDSRNEYTIAAVERFEKQHPEIRSSAATPNGRDMSRAARCR